MSLIENHWQIPVTDGKIDEQLDTMKAAGLDFSPAFLRLCINRGLDSVDKILEATNPEPQLYHDPFLFYQMERAIERLHQAIAAGELILIYGDYDADGITSTLILIEALEELGANFTYYLPNRLIDGYGPNIERYQQFIEEGVRVILTCDNGVAGFEAIEYAQSQGVDVIVSDHHELQETLPSAYAVIHPRHPEGHYPFGELSGAGVALKLAHALLGELPINSMELAAIGTVADLVSLTDENRTIVKSGLKLMSETLRIGLEKMLVEESVDLRKINADTIGFVVGPRLNAVGRLGDPTPALELLKTIDDNEADHLLQKVNEQNKKRQAIVNDITQQVMEQIEHYATLPPIIIAAAPNWPAGVLGIVASKITERYHRPTIIFEYQQAEQRFRGSGRSIEGINLFDCLTENKTYLAQFGGHSQAAGLTVLENEWENFKTAMLSTMADNQAVFEQPKTLNVDMSLPLTIATEEFVEECQLLAPFGMDNPKPVFAFNDVELQQKRVIGNQHQHIKFSIYKDDTSIEGIGFSKANLFSPINLDETFSLIGYLDINEWQGNRQVQIQVLDVKVKGIMIRDFRSSKFNDALLKNRNTVFFYQQPNLKEWLADRVHPSNTMISYDECLNNQELNLDLSHIALIENPNNMEQFNQLMLNSKIKLVDLGVYLTESKWLAGLPSRAEFAAVYRWILGQKNGFDLLKAIQVLSQQMNLPVTKLKCIFKVFFEVKFVIMKDGLTVPLPVEQNVKVDLVESNAYQQYEQSFKTEELLNYQTIEQIKQYINELRKN